MNSGNMNVTQKDHDLFKERVAMKPIKLMLAQIIQKACTEPCMDSPEIIKLTLDSVNQQKLEKELIHWAEIRISNNQNYPSKEGVYASLDSLDALTNVIADAAMQLKK